MSLISQCRGPIRVLVAMTIALLFALSSTILAFANVTLVQLSSDPFTNSTSQHQTEVEPDTFANGSTIVTTFQQGRFTDGGSSDVGWATSQDGGATWTNGSLPNTTFSGGPWARDTDPAVAFDAAHNVWLINSLPLNTSVVGAAI